MGDRGNIKILDNMDQTKAVYLYTHWRGSELPEILQKALAKGMRWNDPCYLARIVFDVMTEGTAYEETGFGISASLDDYNHPTLVINTKKQRVYLQDADTGEFYPFGMYFENFAQGKWATIEFAKMYK